MIERRNWNCQPQARTHTTIMPMICVSSVYLLGCMQFCKCSTIKCCRCRHHPLASFATKKRQLTRPKWNGNKRQRMKKASEQPTNQMIYTFTFYDSSLTHAVSRSHSFQHLKVPAIFLSGPDAIYFFLPLPANSSIFFIGFCWCVLSCACHFNSFTSRSCFLSLSLMSLSVKLTYFLCLPACRSVSVCMYFAYAVAFQDFFHTHCVVCDMHYLFVSYPQ